MRHKKSQFGSSTFRYISSFSQKNFFDKKEREKEREKMNRNLRKISFSMEASLIQSTMFTRDWPFDKIVLSGNKWKINVDYLDRSNPAQRLCTALYERNEGARIDPARYRTGGRVWTFRDCSSGWGGTWTIVWHPTRLSWPIVTTSRISSVSAWTTYLDRISLRTFENISVVYGDWWYCLSYIPFYSKYSTKCNFII